eukprot:7545361-Lingulodinium_polyedra.AAC.1
MYVPQLKRSIVCLACRSKTLRISRLFVVGIGFARGREARRLQPRWPKRDVAAAEQQHVRAR